MRSKPRPSNLPINHSVLYNIQTKKRLSEILHCEASILRTLSISILEYKETTKLTKSGKSRQVQVPQETRKRLHSLLHYYLQQISTPEYLHSGIRRRSPVTNGFFHQGNKYMLKIDVKKFFPSCQEDAAFQFFHFGLKNSVDVAKILAGVCTYNGFIPTGSSLSMDMAFWSYKPTFDRISEIAKECGLTFTLYVDDMCFSSNETIPTGFALQVKNELKRMGLEVHPDKRKYYSARETKVITGVAILPNGEVAVPNRLQKSIVELANSVATIDQLSRSDAKKLMGKISSARQIEKNIFENLRFDLMQYFHELY